MKSIVISRDERILDRLEEEAFEMAELEIVRGFSDVVYAFEFSSENEIELVFVDTDIMGYKIEMFREFFRSKNPDLNFVCISTQSTFMTSITKLHPAAFLAYDFSREDLEFAVEIAILLSKRKRKRIYIRTFGYFDVFVDGKAVMFKSAKAKELLAFLIDRRGGAATTEQIISVLWEDRPNDEASQNLCSKLVKTLQRELSHAGIEDILIISRGNRCVDTALFQCDLYDFLDGRRTARQNYAGEYLLDYSWAECRGAILDRFLHN